MATARRSAAGQLAGHHHPMFRRARWVRRGWGSVHLHRELDRTRGVSPKPIAGAEKWRKGKSGRGKGGRWVGRRIVTHLAANNGWNVGLALGHVIGVGMMDRVRSLPGEVRHEEERMQQVPHSILKHSVVAESCTAREGHTAATSSEQHTKSSFPHTHKHQGSSGCLPPCPHSCATTQHPVATVPVMAP